jgi:hypothetical protein
MGRALLLALAAGGLLLAAGTTDFTRGPGGQLVERDACREGSPEGKE